MNLRHRDMAENLVKKPMSYTSGTENSVHYRKYDDGTYHAWYEGPLNFEAGTFWSNGLYFHRHASYAVPPSFSTGVTSVTASPIASTLGWHVGTDLIDGKYRIVWANYVGTALSNVPVRLDIYGTW